MTDETLNSGEESMGMTDLQFYALERDKWEKREVELRTEFERLCKSDSVCADTGMTDNQSRRFEELIRENERLRRSELPCSESGMTDFQYKQIVEMICQIIKANIEAGKSSEEILQIIAALKREETEA